MLGLCAAPLVHAQAASTSESTPPQTENQTVMLDAFTVNSQGDRGYQSSQSISGSRFVTELKNFPFSLQVLPDRFLQDIGAVTMDDALTYATGTLSTVNNLTPDVYIVQRGFRTTLHLADGLPTPGTFDAFGAERIEVINGPASVLFGITNPGGTVNYVTKKPVSTPMAEFSETIGSWGTNRATADIGGPLAADGAITYRLPVSYYRTDGYFTDSKGWQTYADPTVGFQLGAATRIIVGLEYKKTHQDPESLIPGINNANPLAFALFLPRNWSSSTPRFYLDTETILPSITVTQGFGRHWELRLRSSEYHYIDDLYRSARGAVTIPLYQLPRQPQLDVQDTKFYNENADLVGTFDVPGGKLTTVTGYEFRYNYNETQTKSGLGVGATTPPPWTITDPSTWNYNEDGFAGMTPTGNNSLNSHETGLSEVLQIETLNSRLVISGGVRYDKVDNVLDNYFPKIPTRTFTDVSATTGQAGLLFHLNDAWSVYANYSSAFNPVQGPLYDAAMVPFTPVPISANGYEAGIRSQLLGGRIQQSLSVYQVDQQHIVETLLGVSNLNTAFSYSVQSGLQRSKGIEYNINAAVTDNWAIFGGYSYDDAHIMKDSPTANDVGQRLAFAFRYKIDLYTKYTLSDGPLKNLFGAIGYVYVGNAPGYNGVLNQEQFPAYALTNVTLGYYWKVKHLQVTSMFTVKNLFDRDYLTYVSSRGLPRSVEFSNRFKF